MTRQNRWHLLGDLVAIRAGSGLRSKTPKDGAFLTLEHELPSDEKSEAHWEQYGPGATGLGWEMAIFGLDAHLSSDGQLHLEAGAAWAEGSQGKITLRIWAEAWGEAHVRAGAPAQTARGMDERTTGFYIGES